MQIITEPELLSEVRSLLNRRPELADHPERLAAVLRVDEHQVLACLEALRIEDKVLA